MKKLPSKLTKQDLNNLTSKSQYLTVGKLRDYLTKSELPDDAPVIMQRIEDMYFDTGNWEVYYLDGEQYQGAVNVNNNIDNGEYERKDLKKISDADLEQLKDQYIPVFDIGSIHSENDILFIDAHY